MSRLTGFSPLVKRRISLRASPSDEVVDAYCEVWQECNGAQIGPHHHRRPRRSGGSRRPDTNEAANGLAACPLCHDWIEHNREAAKPLGWLISQFDPRVPSEVPVLRRGQWVLLADNGDVQPIPEPAGGKVA